MLARAAADLDVDVTVLTHDVASSAAQVCPAVVAPTLDAATLIDFGRALDVVTFEHELVDRKTLLAAEAAGVSLQPSAECLGRLVDKIAQRELLRTCGVPAPPHVVARDQSELRRVAATTGFPCVVKSSRGGYDGRGVVVIRDPDELDRFAKGPGVGWLVEPLLDIERELAVQIVRGRGGSCQVYPVVETHQVDGICHQVVVPGDVDADVAATAVGYAHALANATGYVGVLAVELFVVGGELVVNELAPRVHNTAHHSIDACTTSQFENHVRAVLGLPLGPVDLIVDAAVMTNVIATTDGTQALAELVPEPGVRLHLYGKAARPGRKVGHVVACGTDVGVLRHTSRRVADALVTSRRRSDPPGNNEHGAPAPPREGENHG
jgi:5-(carboxyamino)imidazole ribonucleotide synthase